MDQEELKKKIIEILEEIQDPEIGIDVYNLGLIRNIEILDEKRVRISMTLTTLFCPLASVIPLTIIDQLKERLGLDADINIVYDPPWTPADMTEKGRELFKNKFGYDIVEMYKRTTEETKEESQS